MLEAERLAKLQEMQERRKQREAEAVLRQQEKEKERLEAARARDKDREEKLAALHTQHQAHIEELQKKIQLKVGTQPRYDGEHCCVSKSYVSHWYVFVLVCAANGD